jgi:hypothetical protein
MTAVFSQKDIFTHESQFWVLLPTCLQETHESFWHFIAKRSSQAHDKRLKRRHMHVFPRASQGFETLSQTCLPKRITSVWNAVRNMSSQAHHKRLKRCQKHVFPSASQAFETLSRTCLSKHITSLWNAVTNVSSEAHHTNVWNAVRNMPSQDHHKRSKCCHKRVFPSASLTFETLSQTCLPKRNTDILKCCHQNEFSSVAYVSRVVKSGCLYVARTSRNYKLRRQLESKTQQT